MDKKKDFKDDGQKIINFFKSPKGQLITVGFLLLIIIILGSWIRVQNLDLLKDSTTGESIPLALDPFYFLRLAETIVDNGGLPECDSFRVLGDECIGFSKEILPQTVVLIWKTANIFGDYSLQHIDLISPVIFFILGLIVFFFLILNLTDSKITALLSSFLLAIVPAYLYRTMAGFSDHESIGMFAFFSAMLVFSYALKFLQKKKDNKKHLGKSLLWGIGTGFVTAFTIASWGGISRFIFMIVPLSSLIFWLVNIENKKDKFMESFILFYACWFLSSFSFGLLFGFDIINKFRISVLSSSGMITGFVLVFIIADYFIFKNRDYLKKISRNIEKYRIFYSVLLTIILGIIFLLVAGRDVIGLFADIIGRLLNPFGVDRLGLTVAENKQPFLSDWISQTGNTIFYLFLIGTAFVGFNISKGLKKMNHKILFSASWVFAILGIVFSRISETSTFNGNNFISGIFYATSLLVFALSFAYIYIKKGLRINYQLILILSMIFFVLIAGRGAARLFFVITPFMIFMASYSVPNLYDYAKKSKEEILKVLFYTGLGIAIIGLLIAIPGMISSSKSQATYTGPSANVHWQNAMKWVRENTAELSVFSHWWDYGYWVEYLGERPTIADGGHFEGTYRDHMIGRYILTESNVDRTLSFMKSNYVDYLLIDQTDIGKYPAYSSIGSDPEWDRMSSITTLIADQSQIKETAEGEIRVYNGVSGVYEDIVYDQNGSTIFIPGATFDNLGSPNYKAFLIGAIVEVEKGSGLISFEQPKGVFIYNNKQIQIPLRYVYYRGEKIDFGGGLEQGIQILPRAYSQTSGGLQIDSLGSALYFNSRTIDSLVVQLFLLNDPDNKYSSLKLVHKEENPFVENLKTQGVLADDFIYYNGLQGPIKIYEADYPENIIENEEFTRKTLNNWAEFDDIEVKI